MFGLYPLPINWLPGLLNEVENMGLLVFLLVLGRFAHLWKGIKDIYCLVLALGFLELSYLISSTEGKQVSYKDIPKHFLEAYFWILVSMVFLRDLFIFGHTVLAVSV